MVDPLEELQFSPPHPMRQKQSIILGMHGAKLLVPSQISPALAAQQILPRIMKCKLFRLCRTTYVNLMELMRSALGNRLVKELFFFLMRAMALRESGGRKEA